MSVKNSIRFIEYSSVFVLCAFLLMVLALVGSTETEVMHVNFYLLGTSAVLFLIYIFKDRIISNRLKRSRHKGLFYQVLEKMHLSENILLDQEDVRNISVGDYNQETEVFIKENGLNTLVRTRKTHDFLIWGIMVAFLGIVYLLHNLNVLGATDTIMVAVLGLMAIIFCYLFSNYNFFRSGGVVMEFTKEGLHVQDQVLSWNKIIDWQYNRRDMTHNSSITLFYYNTYLEVETVRIELFQLSVRKIDVVLLLSHFKETYGRNIY